MNATAPTARYPALLTIASLTGAAVVAGVLARALVGLLVASDANLTRAVLIMTIIAWAISIVGLLPVILLGPMGVLPTVWGYFIGAGLRVVLGLTGWYLVQMLTSLPADMTGLALVAAYVPLLFVEVGFVAYYLWHKDLAATGQGGSSAGLKVLA